MKRHGSRLIFISKLKKDGTGVLPISPEDLVIFESETYFIRVLSISSQTYIAQKDSTFIVKFKPLNK